MRLLLSLFASFTLLGAMAQHTVDPYSTHSGIPFELVPLLGPNGLDEYEGEYQVHLTDLHWNAQVFDLSFKIEVVSFPFLPADELPQAGERVLGSPDPVHTTQPGALCP